MIDLCECDVCVCTYNARDRHDLVFICGHCRAGRHRKTKR